MAKIKIIYCIYDLVLNCKSYYFRNVFFSYVEFIWFYPQEEAIGWLFTFFFQPRLEDQSFKDKKGDLEIMNHILISSVVLPALPLDFHQFPEKWIKFLK